MIDVSREQATTSYYVKMYFFLSNATRKYKWEKILLYVEYDFNGKKNKIQYTNRTTSQ